MPNFILSALSALLLLSNGVAAKPPSTTTSQICNTQMGTKSIARIPTAKKTVTVSKKPIVAKTVVFSTSTKTPLPTTIIITDTATSTATVTDIAITGTFSTTFTDYITENPTTTFLTTVTVFISIDTTTTTTPSVPTSAGFRPVQDTINGYPAMKREVQLPRPHALEARSAPKKGGKGCGQQYAVAVKCTKSIVIQSTRTLTVTGRPKTVIARQPTSKTTIISTFMTTSTVVPPDVTATESFSTTETITSISSVTSTSTLTSTTVTSTIEVVAPTAYAACAANNFVGPLSDGRNIINAFNNGPSTSTTFRSVGAASAYDCCVVCTVSSDCQASLYQSGSCLILYNKDLTCPADQSLKPSFFTTTTASTSSFVASNGHCGYIFSGNYDGSVSSVAI